MYIIIFRKYNILYYNIKILNNYVYTYIYIYSKKFKCVVIKKIYFFIIIIKNT